MVIITSKAPMAKSANKAPRAFALAAVITTVVIIIMASCCTTIDSASVGIRFKKWSSKFNSYEEKLKS